MSVLYFTWQPSTQTTQDLTKMLSLIQEAREGLRVCISNKFQVMWKLLVQRPYCEWQGSRISIVWCSDTQDWLLTGMAWMDPSAHQKF